MRNVPDKFVEKIKRLVFCSVTFPKIVPVGKYGRARETAHDNIMLCRNCHGKSSIQQEDSFHQKTGLKFKEETSKVLRLEHSFVWC
jgi:hypothetical protein